MKWRLEVNEWWIVSSKEGYAVYPCRALSMWIPRLYYRIITWWWNDVDGGIWFGFDYLELRELMWDIEMDRPWSIDCLSTSLFAWLSIYVCLSLTAAFHIPSPSSPSSSLSFLLLSPSSSCSAPPLSMTHGLQGIIDRVWSVLFFPSWSCLGTGTTGGGQWPS